ncbi:MAG TPA: hypothetical protein VIK09_05000 [Candidatus Humimicrobiaceae bacterium]
MGSITLNIDCKAVQTQIIMEKCNSNYKEFQNCIVDMNNYIVDRFNSLKDEKKILAILAEKGFEKCLKSKATYYVSMCNDINEIEWKHIWVKPFENSNDSKL